MGTGAEDQIVRPGAGFFLRSMFGPTFDWQKEWFNTPQGQALTGGMSSAFNPLISANLYKNAQQGMYFDPNNPASGGVVAGYSIGDAPGHIQAIRDTVGYADGQDPGGNEGWLKESGRWLGFDPTTGKNNSATGGTGALDTMNDMFRSDYGGRDSLLFSDFGKNWDVAKKVYDLRGNVTDDPAKASQDLWGEYRGEIESSGSNPQGDWWVGQTRNNTDRGNQPAGTWAANLGQQHSSRIYGTETSGPQQDDIGQRGLAQTQLLTNPYEQRLINDIDRENELNLADSLQANRSALASAGLGDSGTGRRSMLDTYRRAQEQGQRDKMRTMADIRDRNIGRQAEAINLGTQIGSSAAEARKQRLADANTYQTQLAMQGRQTEQAQDYDAFMRGQLARQGWLQDTSNASLGLMADLFRKQSDQDYGRLSLDADMIKAASGEQRGWQQMENQQKQAALQQNLGYWAQNTGMRNQAFDRQQQYADLDRQIQQARANAMAQYAGIPMETLLKIATGIQSNPVRGTSAPSFGAQIGQNYLGGLAGGLGQENYSIFGQPYANS